MKIKMDNWNSDNIRTFELIKEIVNKGKRISGVDMTNLYNSVFNKSLTPTNCSSCINQRYRQVNTSYNNFIAELKKQEEVLTAIDEFMTPTEEEITPKKRGKIKKEE